METLLFNFKRYSMYLGIFFLGLSLSNCSDDDDVNDIIDPGPTGSITAENLTISQNNLVVQNVTVSTDAWLVVRKVNEDNTFTGLIADPVLLQEGTHSNVEIELNNTLASDVNLEDEDTVVIMLHADDGDGVFDENDDDTIDDSTGSAVTDTVVITAPSFTISDQAAVDNTITFENVTTPQGGWIVVYDQNPDGTINEDAIIARQFVEAGTNENVIVTFDEDFTFTSGQTIFSRLHLDDPDDQEFTFETDPTTDIVATFGFGADNTITNTGTVVN